MYRAIVVAVLLLGAAWFLTTGETTEFPEDAHQTKVPTYDTQYETAFLIPAAVQPTNADQNTVETTTRTSVDESVVETVNTAYSVVDEQTKYNPQGESVTVTLDPQLQWDTIYGSSGGLAYAAQIAATDSRYTLRDDVVLTGGINSDGTTTSTMFLSEKINESTDTMESPLIISASPTDTVDTADQSVIVVTEVETALYYALTPTTNQTEVDKSELQSHHETLCHQ